MDPIISYYGGKQKMAKKIIELLYPHTVYAEPFCGGAAILFAKGRSPSKNDADYIEVLNDTSDLLINLYRVIQDAPDEFLHRIEFTLFSESEHRRAAEICRNPLGRSPMEKAWGFYVKIQQSFSHDLTGGWKRSVYSRNLATTWKNKTDKLKQKLERFSRVVISNSDALEFIRKFDSPQTCFYIDPPYPGASCGHYKGYDLEDFKKLIELLNNIHGSFVLSNYDQIEVDIPGDWERFEFETNCYASGKYRVGMDKGKKQTQLGSKRTEIIWRRPSKFEPRKELLKKLWCPVQTKSETTPGIGWTI